MKERGMRRCLSILATLALVVVTATPGLAEDTNPSNQEAMYYRFLEFPSMIEGGSIRPGWMADGSSFWYAEGAPDQTIIYKVNPEENSKAPLFDVARLRRALAQLLGHEPPYEGLPFRTFTFLDGERSVRFTVGKSDFIIKLDTYEITRASALSSWPRMSTK